MSTASATTVSTVRVPEHGHRLRLGLLAVLVVAGAGCNSDVWVFVDNACEEPMVVTLDGQQQVTVAPGEYEIVKCPPGEHQFHVQCGERVLFEGRQTLEESGRLGVTRKYLFNPDNRNRYRTYTVDYGSSIFEGLFDADDELDASGDEDAQLRAVYQKVLEAAELLPSDAWLDIGYAQHVLEPEPESVVSRSSKVTRSVLARIEPKDYEFIARARENQNPTEDDLQALIEVMVRVVDSGT